MRRSPRPLLALSLVGLAFVALLTSACTGVASPKGWASPILLPDDSSEGELLLAAHRDALLALDPATLDGLWAFPPAAGDEDIDVVALYGTPAADDDRVFVSGYDGTLYALDRATGDLQWSFEDPDGPLIGGVAVGQDTVYFGSADTKVYALDAASGTPRWAPFDTGDAVWATPTLQGDVLYVTSLDGRLYALDAESGSELWSFQTDAGVASPPLVDEEAGLVYVGGFDSQLRAIDLETHEEMWSLTADNWFWMRALLADGALYAASLDGRVFAVDARSGDLLWAQPFSVEAPVRAAPLLVAGVLVIIDRDGNVYALDPTDGSAAFDEPLALDSDVLADPLVRPALPSDGDGGEELLVVTTDGDLVRIDGATLRISERIELSGG